MRRLFTLKSLILVAALAAPSAARADSIQPGTFSLAVAPLTLLLPGLNLLVTVQGNSTVNLPTGGLPPATIPIEIVALSLQSISPVSINSSLFDVSLTLAPNTISGGSGTVGGGGAFDSFFDVYFEVTFTPSGGGQPVSTGQPIPVSLIGTLIQDPQRPGQAYWQLLCQTSAGRQDISRCTVPPPPAPVPEPATMLLLGSGLAGIFLRRRLQT
jgi:hypothetical protein